MAPFPRLLQGQSPLPAPITGAAARSSLLPAPQTQTGQCWDELGYAISASALTGLPGGLQRETPHSGGRILPRCPSMPALGPGAASPVPSHGCPRGTAPLRAPCQWEPVRFWWDTGRLMEVVGNCRAGSAGHKQNTRSREGIATQHWWHDWAELGLWGGGLCPPTPPSQPCHPSVPPPCPPKCTVLSCSTLAQDLPTPLFGSHGGPLSQWGSPLPWGVPSPMGSHLSHGGSPLPWAQVWLIPGEGPPPSEDARSLLARIELLRAPAAPRSPGRFG